MPRVVCPRCAASVLAVPVGHTVALRAAVGANSCVELPGGAGGDGLLRCGAMAAAVEQALETLVKPSLTALWPADGEQNRLYERWRPMTAVLRSGSKSYQCVVLDISPGGAAIWTEASAEVPEGAEVQFTPDGHEALPAEVVRLSGGVLGLMFLIDEAPRRALAAWLTARRQAAPAGR